MLTRITRSFVRGLLPPSSLKAGSHQPLRLEPLEDRLCLSTVAYWRFDEGVADARAHGADSIVDQSGHALHGSPQSGPVYRDDVKDDPIPQTGELNALSLQFDGINERVLLPDYEALALTKSLTIEAYVKRTGPQGWLGNIFYRGDDRIALDPYYFTIWGNDLHFHVENASGQQAKVSAPLTTLNKWFHVASSLNDASGVMNLYIDGQLVDSTTTSVRPFAQLDVTKNPGTAIGGLQSDTICCQYIHGFIDELRISDKALRPSEFLNSAAPFATHFEVTTSPDTTAGKRIRIQVAALNNFGSIDKSYAGTIHFSSSDPAAMLPSDYTFAPQDNGIHEFTAILKTAGNQTVTAADMLNGSIHGETDITVHPSSAMMLEVSGFPSPVISGSVHTFTVTARDAYGNVATGYQGAVHFTSSDLQAILPGDYTFSPGDNGTKIFGAVLFTVGTHDLTATDTANGAIAGTQAGIIVLPIRSERESETRLTNYLRGPINLGYLVGMIPRLMRTRSTIAMFRPAYNLNFLEGLTQENA